MDKSLRNKIILIICLLAILSISLVVRFYDLEMDSFTFERYGTIWFDEGAWIHNARNKVLFGVWDLENDLYKPRYFSPIFNFLSFISFSILGVSTFSMRLVPAILGIISILIASFLIMLKRPKEGIVYFILLSLNTMSIAYSRVAMLECMALFFILIILGLMVYNTKYSWILVGFLVPFLLFSKLTSIFFILAIPLSFTLYYFMYKSKNILKKFKMFLIGIICSSVLWLFWFIPNFKNWVFMNLSIGMVSRISINFHKIAGAILKALKFSLINPVVIILTIISVLFIFVLIKKKEEVPFIDFFLIVSLVLFFLQVLLADYELRRFVLIIPIILLISIRFICRLPDIKIYIKNNSFKISKTLIIILFIIIYLIFHFAQLGTYFGRIKSFDVHIIINNSKDINNYIPPNSNVYGHYANALSLENKIKPYFIDYFNPQNTKIVLQLLEEKKMNYAILDTDLFDEKALSQYSITPAIYDYIRDNFEVIAILDSKSTSTDCLDRKVYIYKRKIV